MIDTEMFYMLFACSYTQISYTIFLGLHAALWPEQKAFFAPLKSVWNQYLHIYFSVLFCYLFT